MSYLPDFKKDTPYSITECKGCYQFRCLVNRGTMGLNSLPKTVTRQRRGCDLNPGPTASKSSMLTIRLLSHPLLYFTQW